MLFRSPGCDTVLLTVGRLQRRKGHDLAIEAMTRVRSEVPGVKYLIVGDGDERPRLEALVDTLGLRDTVTFVGTVKAGDLPACYGAADVFVHPNRVDNGDVEGFGIVFLEAAAAGLPVIGGNSGGVPEAIDVGRSGVLVSGTDVGELADAIVTLARDGERRRRMGEAGCRFVATKFSWERAAGQVLAVHRLVERTCQ